MNTVQALTLDSREVAGMMSKQHAHLCRDISRYSSVLLKNPNLDSSNFFIESSYKQTGNGKSVRCYLLTRKGCEFVANKMTGEKGILFTANYINRFHEMEQELMKKQAAKKEKKPDYDKLGFYEVPKWLNRMIESSVDSHRGAEACFDVIVSLLPPKVTAPVQCLVRRYGELIHYSRDCEDRAIKECGDDNYNRYAAHYSGYLYFCEENKK